MHLWTICTTCHLPHCSGAETKRIQISVPSWILAVIWFYGTLQAKMKWLKLITLFNPWCHLVTSASWWHFRQYAWELVGSPKWWKWHGCVISLLLCMNGLRNTRIFATIIASKYRENSDSLNRRFELPILEHRCQHLPISFKYIYILFSCLLCAAC